jgi:hypothetical protein
VLVHSSSLLLLFFFSLWHQEWKDVACPLQLGHYVFSIFLGINPSSVDSCSFLLIIFHLSCSSFISSDAVGTAIFFLIFTYIVRNRDDAFFLVAELRFLAVGEIVVCSVWYGFSLVPPMVRFNEDVYPASSIFALMSMAILWLGSIV